MKIDNNTGKTVGFYERGQALFDKMVLANKTHIILTWEEFEAQFKPIKNPFGEDAALDGFMFETYEPEATLVKAADPMKVWTHIDGDNNCTLITEGWHYVNRIGYVLTEVPFDPNCTYEIDYQEYGEE